MDYGDIRGATVRFDRTPIIHGANEIKNIEDVEPYRFVEIRTKRSAFRPLLVPPHREDGAPHPEERFLCRMASSEHTKRACQGELDFIVWRSLART